MSGIKGKSGGFRKNAKRPYKYGEPMKMVSARVPISKVNDFKEKVKIIIDSYKGTIQTHSKFKIKVQH